MYSAFHIYITYYSVCMTLFVKVHYMGWEGDGFSYGWHHQHRGKPPRVSSRWSSVLRCLNIVLSSKHYGQFPIVFKVWPLADSFYFDWLDFGGFMVELYFISFNYSLMYAFLSQTIYLYHLIFFVHHIEIYSALYVYILYTLYIRL